MDPLGARDSLESDDSFPRQAKSAERTATFVLSHVTFGPFRSTRHVGGARMHRSGTGRSPPLARRRLTVPGHSPERCNLCPVLVDTVDVGIDSPGALIAAVAAGIVRSRWT